MGNKIIDNLKKRHCIRMAVLLSALEKEGEKKKKNVISTRVIRIWSPIQVLPFHEQGLTLLSGRNMLLFL